MSEAASNRNRDPAFEKVNDDNTVQQKNFFSWYLEKFYLFLGIFWPLNSNLLSVFPHHVRFLRYQDTHFYFFS